MTNTDVNTVSPHDASLQKDLLNFKAFHFAERLKINTIRKEFAQVPLHASGMELVYQFEYNQWVLFYSFGSVVFFNARPETENLVRHVLKNILPPKEFAFDTEEFCAQIAAQVLVDFEKVTAPAFEQEQISIVSWVLAQSVALEYFERVVDEVLEQSGTISEDLEKRGRIKRTTHEMTKFIGFCINTKHKILSSTYILDMPEPTWTEPQLEQMYLQMADQFEIRSRYRTLEHKLRFIQDTLEVLSQMSYSRHSIRLEIAIVVLIAVEIILIVWELLK